MTEHVHIPNRGGYRWLCCAMAGLTALACAKEPVKPVAENPWHKAGAVSWAETRVSPSIIEPGHVLEMRTKALINGDTDTGMDRILLTTNVLSDRDSLWQPWEPVAVVVGKEPYELHRGPCADSLLAKQVCCWDFTGQVGGITFSFEKIAAPRGELIGIDVTITLEVSPAAQGGFYCLEIEVDDTGSSTIGAQEVNYEQGFGCPGSSFCIQVCAGAEEPMLTASCVKQVPVDGRILFRIEARVDDESLLSHELTRAFVDLTRMGMERCIPMVFNGRIFLHTGVVDHRTWRNRHGAEVILYNGGCLIEIVQVDWRSTSAPSAVGATAYDS